MLEDQLFWLAEVFWVPMRFLKMRKFSQGLITWIRIRQRDRSCTIINLHYQPEGSLQELRRRLRAAAAVWCNYPEGKGFLVGHFNIFDPAEGRPNARTQTFSDGDLSRAAALLTALPRAVEIDGPYCSRKDSRRDGSIHTLSSTDRIFTIFQMAESRDFQCQSHTVETVGDRSIPSDHVPVRLIIECPRHRKSGHPVILRWLAKHPLFDCALREEHRNMMYGSRRWRPVRVARPDKPF